LYRVGGALASGAIVVGANAQTTVTAAAAEGYELAEGAVSQWTHAFTAEPCPEPDIEVTPKAPAATEVACADSAPTTGSLEIPAVEGVRYTVDGEEVTGTLSIPAGTSVSVRARPLAGYVFDGVGQVVTYAFAFPVPECTPAPAQVIVGSVTVTGSAVVGSKLTTAATADWGPDGVRLAYQWQADGADIPGATGSTLSISPTLEGAVLRVRVSGFGDGLVGASTVSAGVGPVAPAAFSAATPKITGKAKTGGTVQVTVGTWMPQPTTFAYQWLADGVAIEGATAASFRIPSSLAGKELTVTVTGSRNGYETLSVTSQPVRIRR
jgi:hypothetical protein